MERRSLVTKDEVRIRWLSIYVSVTKATARAVRGS